MDKIFAFYNQHKDQIHMAAVGVVLVVAAYIAYELVVVLAGLLVGGTMHTSRKEREEHRERFNEIVKEQEQAKAELESIRQSAKVAETKAERKAAQDVDDFIDGEWK